MTLTRARSPPCQIRWRLNGSVLTAAPVLSKRQASHPLRQKGRDLTRWRQRQTRRRVQWMSRQACSNSSRGRRRLATSRQQCRGECLLPTSPPPRPPYQSPSSPSLPIPTQSPFLALFPSLPVPLLALLPSLPVPRERETRWVWPNLACQSATTMALGGVSRMTLRAWSLFGHRWDGNVLGCLAYCLQVFTSSSGFHRYCGILVRARGGRVDAWPAGSA